MPKRAQMHTQLAVSVCEKWFACTFYSSRQWTPEAHLREH